MSPRIGVKAEDLECKVVQSRSDAKSARILMNPQQPLAIPANGRKKPQLRRAGVLQMVVPRHHGSNNTLTAPDDCEGFADILP